jgi:hypothetical protein
MFPELKDNVANTNRIRKSISKNLKKIYCWMKRWFYGVNE